MRETVNNHPKKNLSHFQRIAQLATPVRHLRRSSSSFCSFVGPGRDTTKAIGKGFSNLKPLKKMNSDSKVGVLQEDFITGELDFVNNRFGSRNIPMQTNKKKEQQECEQLVKSNFFLYQNYKKMQKKMKKTTQLSKQTKMLLNKLKIARKF